VVGFGLFDSVNDVACEDGFDFAVNAKFDDVRGVRWN